VAQRRPTAETGRLSGRLDSDRATEAVRVKLLGGFSVSVGDREIGQSDWRLKKAAALVKLLALAPGHRLHREQIMNLLWPDSGRKAASSSLRTTLHSARKVLDAEVGSRYLASGDEQLVLCPDASLWVDVESFEDAAAAAHRSRDPAAYRAALDLYAGDLLPGDRYEQWAEEKREELRGLYLELLVELAKTYEEREDLERAVELDGKLARMRLSVLCFSISAARSSSLILTPPVGLWSPISFSVSLRRSISLLRTSMSHMYLKVAIFGEYPFRNCLENHVVCPEMGFRRRPRGVETAPIGHFSAPNNHHSKASGYFPNSFSTKMGE
jgi:hypothetical protein